MSLYIRTCFMTIGIIILLVLCFYGNSMAMWPQENDWIPFINNDWENIEDSAGDTNADYLDYVSDSVASAYWYFDEEYLFFRSVLNGDPVKYKKGNPEQLLPYGWNVLVEVTGDNYADYSISIDGTGGSDTLHTEYNLDQDNKMDGETGYSITATEDPYIDGDYTYLINSKVRVKKITEDKLLWIDGDPDYYLETKVSLNWLSRQNYSDPPPVTENTVLKFATGSGASAQNINKDLVGQTNSIDLYSFYDDSPSVSLDGNYGILRDSRHIVNLDDYGLWYINEQLEVIGEGWPVGSSNYYTGGLSLRIENSDTEVVWDDSVAVGLDGIIPINLTWIIEYGNKPGVYKIYVENPRNPGEYNLKDTFTLKTPVLETSFKEVNSENALPGEQLDYTIGVINSGNYTAENVIVEDIFPPETLYVTESTYSDGIHQPDLNGQSALKDGLIVGDLNPDTQSDISFSLKIAPDIINQIQVNNIAIIRFDASLYQRTQINREANTVVDSPQITIRKSSDVNHVFPQDIITYNSVCENIGSSVANNVVVVDQIPSNTSYQLNSISPDNSNAGVEVYFKHEENGNFDQNETKPIIALKWVFDTIVPEQSKETSFEVKIN